MTTAALTAGLERIPDQLGYLVISEDGVLASAGELENDEQTAAVMMQMVRTASRFKLPGSAEPPFKRMSESICGQTSEQPAGTNQHLEVISSSSVLLTLLNSSYFNLCI
uniref:Ragulator complex protein LAMTOR4 n=1 Tax=Gasterosteus aculeatus aculeatus TaxID=481459 RepID=A0AAQ4RF41_GASAC